jgi:hypothetical protein
MPRFVAARAGLLLSVLLLAGCLPDFRRKAEPSIPPRPPEVEAPAELVYINFAVVECPLGDEYLNRELWQEGDESVVPLELVLHLENNGLRACRLGGTLPPRLLKLLTSRRTCPQPRRLRTLPGQPAQLVMGPRREGCQFELQSGDGPRHVELKGAECLFEALPRVADGELSLKFTPQARYGEVRRRAEAERAPDGSLRWALANKPPTEDYPAVAFEVSLSPGEFLVLGPRVERKGTLGATWFAGENESGPTQKLIVLRAARVGGTREEGTRVKGGPIALQVREPMVRGMRP